MDYWLTPSRDMAEFLRTADLRLLDGINDTAFILREVSFAPPYRRWGRGPGGEWELLSAARPPL
jgi:hypothetical protein